MPYSSNLHSEAGPVADAEAPSHVFPSGPTDLSSPQKSTLTDHEAGSTVQNNDQGTQKSSEPTPKTPKLSQESEEAGASEPAPSSPSDAVQSEIKSDFDSQVSSSQSALSPPVLTRPRPKPKAKTSRFKRKKSSKKSADKANAEAQVVAEDSDDDTIPADSGIQYHQHEDPHRITVSSIVEGMTPWTFLGMVLDDRCSDVIRAHKPALGRRYLLEEGDYKPAPEPWHKEEGHELFVHKNVTESIVARMLRTADAYSYIKFEKGFTPDSDKVYAMYKVIIPKFRRVDMHGDVTITRLEPDPETGAKRVRVATDVYMNLNIPLIGTWIESFMKSQIRIGYKILTVLVNDFLALPPAPHPLEHTLEENNPH